MNGAPGSRVCYQLVALWLLACCATLEAQSAQQNSNSDSMLASLERLLAEEPTRADTWRLLGRVHRKHNRNAAAMAAFRRALELQPDNAAAHYDVGELMEQIGNQDAASYHFHQVMRLAPASSYAVRLVERGWLPPPEQAGNAATTGGIGIMTSSVAGIPNALDAGTSSPRSTAADGTESAVELAGFEIQTFDGADDLDQRLNQLQSDARQAPNRLRAFIEFGALYNTNVTLTPISRELSPGQFASAQAFLSPDLEWVALRRGVWRAGPLGRGYFTLNEDDFRAFDLASFQPGVFIERDLQIGDHPWIGRFDYVYGLDLLDGQRFGERHTATASLTMILPDFDVIYAYFRTSQSDFADGGSNPSVDSLDGASISVGVSRFFQTEHTLLPTWSIGADVESVDTLGADYRYQGVTMYSEMTIKLSSTISLIPQGGIGYRNYGDFTGLVSRDELTWRGGGKLRWTCSEFFSIAAVVSYNRFASRNEDFDADRMEAGVVATVTH